MTGITEAFKADSFKEKINLGVGAYREHLKDPSLSCPAENLPQAMTMANHMSYLRSDKQTRRSPRPT